MKKIFSLLLFLLVTTSFAKTVTIHAKAARSQDVTHWQFTSLDDGVVFILGPESDKKLFIKVNKTLSNGLAADPVTVNCNNTTYRLEPDMSVTCYGNINDMSWMGIAPNDFKNGSEGDYIFIPLTK